jgi:hypothetical protein
VSVSVSVEAVRESIEAVRMTTEVVTVLLEAFKKCAVRSRECIEAVKVFVEMCK